MTQPDLQRRAWLAASVAMAVEACQPMVALAAEPPIVVGQIGPFTNLPAPDAKLLNQGMRAAFEQANAAGGINGRPLTLFELDDGYSADGFVARFAEAMKRQPVALLSPVGSVAIKRLLDERLLDKADVVVLNAVPGAESLRSPGHPRLFFVRAGDRHQVECIVRHAQVLGVSHMAVLHQDLPVGTSALAMAQRAGKEQGVQITPFVSTKDRAPLAEAADKVAASHPQSVLVVGAPPFMAEGIAALTRAGVRQFVYALSDVSPEAIDRLSEGKARGVALAQNYPNPNGAKLALQREFQAAMKHGPAGAGPYSLFQLEGYICARVLVEALRRGRDASAATLARTLGSMGELNLGGFRVSFAKDNNGSSFVDIALVGEGGKLVY
jgi:branched-chain amino acid transport system substrate-binding protein